MERKQKNYAIFGKRFMILLRDLYNIDFVDARVNRKFPNHLVYYYENNENFQMALKKIMEKI